MTTAARVADGSPHGVGQSRGGGREARVARGSRILVEGVHDAELVEKVWGDDLRIEGVVVERLDGADHLDDEVRAFGPGPGRRLGVLLDHLVAGSKEARLAAAVRHPHVLVTGTPVRRRVGRRSGRRSSASTRGPTIPKGRTGRTGVCARSASSDPPRVLAAHPRLGARAGRDLEQPLVAAVEQLIDFVTTPADA